jgi:hypothetical protein
MCLAQTGDGTSVRLSLYRHDRSLIPSGHTVFSFRTLSNNLVPSV